MGDEEFSNIRGDTFMAKLYFTVGGLIFLFTTLLNGMSSGQSSISGPILGRFFDEREGKFSVIQGIPGAATIGEAGDLDIGLTKAEVSPLGNYAIGIAEDYGEPVLIRFDGVQPNPQLLEGLKMNPGRIDISPSGSCAVLYYEPDRLIVVVGSLPDTPRVVARISILNLLSKLTAMAVSDDGEVVLIGASQGSRSFVYAVSTQMQMPEASDDHLFQNESGKAPNRVSVTRPEMISPVGLASAIVFFPHSNDALVADSGQSEIILLRDVLGSADHFTLASAQEGIAEPVAVGISDEGDRVMVGNSASSNVVIFNLLTGQTQSLDCYYPPTKFQRLNVNSVFRLTDPGGRPILLLDGGVEQPRIVFVPIGSR
jgi:WD40 repeat protein